MEMIPIFKESRLLAMKQMQNSREKFDFYGVAMRLRRETACFYEEGVALVGHRTTEFKNIPKIVKMMFTAHKVTVFIMDKFILLALELFIVIFHNVFIQKFISYQITTSYIDVVFF